MDADYLTGDNRADTGHFVKHENGQFEKELRKMAERAMLCDTKLETNYA